MIDLIVIYLNNNKKCFIKCKVVSEEDWEDVPCMDLVEAEYNYVENENQTALMRESISNENQMHNVGLVYLEEQTEAGNEVYTEDDLFLRDMLHTFTDVTDEEFYRR